MGWGGAPPTILRFKEAGVVTVNFWRAKPVTAAPFLLATYPADQIIQTPCRTLRDAAAVSPKTMTVHSQNRQSKESPR